jgi:restriction endonuclease S subunit
MRLDNVANVRTGLVLSRKVAELEVATNPESYEVLSLRAVSGDGVISKEYIEPYCSTERLKSDYLTRKGDVLFRLSAPYTAVCINDDFINLLIPSHFSVIRTNTERLDPIYLEWWLNHHKTLFYKMASGGTMMGTISSGFVAALEVDLIPLESQRLIGEIITTSKYEQELLLRLSKSKQQLTDSAIELIINGGIIK